MPDMKPLQEELAERKESCVCKARGNYFVAYVLLIAGVVASAVTTILVASDNCFLSSEMTAALAALPGIIILAMNTFKFEGRADWWWTKHHGLDALLRGLLYEQRSEAEVSKDLSTFISSIEEKWPSFGKPPSGPNG